MRWLLAFAALAAGAAEPPPIFPSRAQLHSLPGRLVAADYLHRSGSLLASEGGELVDFTLPSCGYVTYGGIESDLREVPLGTPCEVLLDETKPGPFAAVALQTVGVEAPPDLRQRHHAWVKARGLPAWIDRIDGKLLTVTYFAADRASLQEFFKAENLVPAQWASEHRRVQVAVADEHLRTWNPVNDSRGSKVVEVREIPSEGLVGSSGEQWVVEPDLLLEGFRRGRIVRIFPGGWKIDDMPFGEQIYDDMPAEETRLQAPELYPYRTDFAHPELHWYTLQPNRFPPFLSEHRTGGDLVKVEGRTGQFREDRTGRLVNFTLPPFAPILHVNTEAELADLPLGTHALFYLYPDARGAFTQAAQVVDDPSYLAINKVSLRVLAAPDAAGRLPLARKIDPVKDFTDALVQPPDIGAAEWEATGEPRVWKGKEQLTLAALKTGDDVFISTTGHTSRSVGRCTDLWLGAESLASATEAQRQKFESAIKQSGHPGWIEKVDGRKLTVVFFGARRSDAPTPRLAGDDPKNRKVVVQKADEQLRLAEGEGAPGSVLSRQPEGLDTPGTYGSSGVRWEVLLAADGEFQAGQVVRIRLVE